MLIRAYGSVRLCREGLLVIRRLGSLGSLVGSRERWDTVHIPPVFSSHLCPLLMAHHTECHVSRQRACHIIRAQCLISTRGRCTDSAPRLTPLSLLLLSPLCICICGRPLWPSTTPIVLHSALPAPSHSELWHQHGEEALHNHPHRRLCQVLVRGLQRASTLAIRLGRHSYTQLNGAYLQPMNTYRW